MVGSYAAFLINMKRRDFFKTALGAAAVGLLAKVGLVRPEGKWVVNPHSTWLESRVNPDGSFSHRVADSEKRHIEGVPKG